MELLISLIVGVVVLEAYAWLNPLCEWLVRKAVSYVQVEEQERAQEEWTESLGTLPNSAVRLIHALSYVASVPRIRSDFREQALEELDEAILEFPKLASELEQPWERVSLKVIAYVSRATNPENSLKRSTESLLATLIRIEKKVRSNPESKISAGTVEELAEALQRCREATGSFGNSTSQTITEEVNKLLEKIERYSAEARKIATALRDYIPALEKLRSSRMRHRDWEAAYYKISRDLDDYVSALHKLSEQTTTVEPIADDIEDDDQELKEFNDAFTALKVLGARLRSNRPSAASV